MGRTDADGPFRLPGPDGLAAIKATFDRVGYTDENIAPIIQIDGERRPAFKKIPMLMRRTAGGSPLETFIRLFIIGSPVDLDAVRVAMDPDTPERWEAIGLLTIVDGEVRATVQVRYFRGLLVAFDFHHRISGPLAGDFVMGMSTSSLNLAGVAIAEPAASTLDLGTGSGILAMLASAHSEEVIATDLNPRAVAIARLNAGINGLGIEVLEGDGFTPVAGRRFDRILSNAPFVISPDSSHLFLGGGGDDSFCRRLAEEAPQHLVEGGWCQFLANWVVPAVGDAEERLAGWFADNGCDVWILTQGDLTAEQYASQWIETGDTAEAFGDRLEAWLEHFAATGIAGVGSGLVTMRRRTAADNWLRIEPAPEEFEYPSGADIRRGMAARAWAERAADDEVLATRPRLAGDIEIHQILRPGQDGWQLAKGRLVRSSGLMYRAEVDTPGMEVLRSFDGRRTLRELGAEVAGRYGADTTEVTTSLVPLVRRLYEQGLVELGLD